MKLRGLLAYHTFKITENPTGNFFRYLFLVGFITTGIVFAILTFLFLVEKETRLEQVASERRANIDFQEKLIFDIFETTISDLKFLASQNELKILIGSDSDQARNLAEQEYLNFIRYKNIYDQVRFVDQQGQEVVHVYYNKGQPFVVPRDQLENKKDQPYFQKGMALERGDVYVSPMSLIFENGKVEIPLKPVIRFAMPVFDDQLSKRGLVILNYLGAKLIDSLRESGSFSRGNTYLLDADGYWLCALDPNHEWGSLLEERKHCNFAKQFPLEWDKISHADFVQFTNLNGMFTARTFFPSLEVLKKKAGRAQSQRQDEESYIYHWKLISHVPFETLHKNTSILLKEFLWVGIILFFSSLAPIWMIAKRMETRKTRHERMFFSANYDEVTGLLKRTPFVEKLGDTYEGSLRYQRKFALLFIDLDDFKLVNDTYGHLEGDKVLKEAARRLIVSIRKSDTVGRMGGDEFAVLLPVIEHPKDAETVAKKFLKELSVPFFAAHHHVQLGASIGICHFPRHKDPPELLLKKADEAMYVAKRSGKNNFHVAD